MPHHALEFYMGDYNIFNTINPIGTKFGMYSHRQLCYKEVEADLWWLLLFETDEFAKKVEKLDGKPEVHCTVEWKCSQEN